MEEMRFSEQLIFYRKKHNLSQEELAEKLYISRQTVSNWENNKSFPDITNLFLLSVLFDVTLDHLVKGETDILKNVKLSKTYRKILVFRDILSLICVFIIIFGRNFYGNYFSIITAFIGLTIFIISSFLLHNIQKKAGIEKKIYNFKEAEDILLFLENPNMTQEKFNRIKQKEKKKRFVRWIITIILFFSFILLSAYISHLFI